MLVTNATKVRMCLSTGAGRSVRFPRSHSFESKESNEQFPSTTSVSEQNFRNIYCFLDSDRVVFGQFHVRHHITRNRFDKLASINVE